MLFRRIESLAELTSIIGSRALDRARNFLLASELFSVLQDLEFLARGRTLTFLNGYASFDAASKRAALEDAVLKSGMTSFGAELEAERTEQGRYYSEEKSFKALKRFSEKAQVVSTREDTLAQIALLQVGACNSPP